MEKDEDKPNGLDKPANPMGEDLEILESDKKPKWRNQWNIEGSLDYDDKDRNPDNDYKDTPGEGIQTKW